MRLRLSLLFVLISFPVLAPAQNADSSVMEKLWPGFGAGSMKQGDSLNARRFKTADVVGVSLIGAGVIGIVGTAIERDLLLAMVGETTRADYYICGGIALAGLATLVTSRILAVQKTKKYNLMPVACRQGGGGLALIINF